MEKSLEKIIGEEAKLYVFEVIILQVTKGCEKATYKGKWIALSEEIGSYRNLFCFAQRICGDRVLMDA